MQGEKTESRRLIGAEPFQVRRLKNETIQLVLSLSKPLIINAVAIEKDR